jgi:hypothetical protein
MYIFDHLKLWKAIFIIKKAMGWLRPFPDRTLIIFKKLNSLHKTLHKMFSFSLALCQMYLPRVQANKVLFRINILGFAIQTVRMNKYKAEDLNNNSFNHYYSITLFYLSISQWQNTDIKFRGNTHLSKILSLLFFGFQPNISKTRIKTENRKLATTFAFNRIGKLNFFSSCQKWEKFQPLVHCCRLKKV